jgi:hypothetical protein
LCYFPGSARCLTNELFPTLQHFWCETSKIDFVFRCVVTSKIFEHLIVTELERLSKIDI